MLKISNGKVARPQRVVVFGPEGIGKSTFASKFPNPLFLDTEGGTAHMDVRRIDRPDNWDELIAIINEVAATAGICKTLVVDTADWAEQLAITYVCAKYKKAGIEDFGYSKGYVYLAEEFGRFLAALDRVVGAGMHVVITAHAKMRKFEQPDEMGSYDRWEMKLTKQVSPLLKEWCDLLLFCNYKTFVVQGDNAMEKAKVQGGKRVIYATHHPCWDAKNRHGLPDVMDLDFENIAHIFNGNQASAPQEKPISKILALMAEANITEAEVQRVVSDKGHYPVDSPISEYSDKFVNGWLLKYWQQVTEIIKANRSGSAN